MALPTLSASTKVAASVVVGAMVLTWWAGMQFSDIKASIVDGRVEATKGILATNVRLDRIEDHLGDRYTLTDMALWVAEFRRLNPTITVPPASSVR